MKAFYSNTIKEVIHVFTIMVFTISRMNVNPLFVCLTFIYFHQ